MMAQAGELSPMSLKLYFHPLSSFCHKALIALYEASIPFEPIFVDLRDEKSSAALRALWPIAKFPVLHDDARNCTVPESTTIILYLDAYYPGGARFVPAGADQAWQVNLWDRIYDHYIHLPMQKAVGDSFRPPDNRDPVGVEQAKAQMRKAFDLADEAMQSRTWAIGENFTLADCAAAPALFYANLVSPFGQTHKNLAAYLGRLMARESYARVLKEAEPYFQMFPLDNKPRIAAP
jgi:glutathione S-transferase